MSSVFTALVVLVTLLFLTPPLYHLPQAVLAAIILVARYHDELRRTPDGWKISKRVMELLWGETKPDAGYLDSLGGRGPKIWARS